MPKDKSLNGWFFLKMLQNVLQHLEKKLEGRKKMVAHFRRLLDVQHSFPFLCGSVRKSRRD